MVENNAGNTCKPRIAPIPFVMDGINNIHACRNILTAPTILPTSITNLPKSDVSASNIGLKLFVIVPTKLPICLLMSANPSCILDISPGLKLSKKPSANETVILLCIPFIFAINSSADLPTLSETICP